MVTVQKRPAKPTSTSTYTSLYIPTQNATRKVIGMYQACITHPSHLYKKIIPFLLKRLDWLTPCGVTGGGRLLCHHRRTAGPQHNSTGGGCPPRATKPAQGLKGAAEAAFPPARGAHTRESRCSLPRRGAHTCQADAAFPRKMLLCDLARSRPTPP